MTDWEGGVRGVSIVAGGLVPEERHNTTWPGLASQVDIYATLARVADVPTAAVACSGPVPPDSINLWDAISTGAESPRSEIVHNINGAYAGGLRMGRYKLLVGDPNEAGRGTCGWTPPAEMEMMPNEEATGSPCLVCVDKPCLFDIANDPEERHDLSSLMPAKMQQILRRYRQLQASEVKLKQSCAFRCMVVHFDEVPPQISVLQVTLEKSGLCPETATYNHGGVPDASEPDGCIENQANGHWQPWL
jgi:hypothetical protein